MDFISKFILSSKRILVLLLTLLLSQSYAQTKLFEKESITVDKTIEDFVGVDTFENYYYITNNVFYKKTPQQQWQYSNLLLGELTHVSIFNPLKIILFYKETNTVVILDRFLTEIKTIDFNVLDDFKAVELLDISFDQNLWLFNQNTQQLETFNTRTNITSYTTQPLNDTPSFLLGGFNFSWVILPEYLYQFNSYGSLLQKIVNDGFLKLQNTQNGLILLKANELYYKATDSLDFQKLKLPEIPIKQFYVTNEILYIYHKSKIYRFGLESIKK